MDAHFFDEDSVAPRFVTASRRPTPRALAPLLAPWRTVLHERVRAWTTTVQSSFQGAASRPLEALAPARGVFAASPSSGRVWAASGAGGSGGHHHEGESPLAKLIIGGGSTVVFEAFLGGHMLEFLKITKQTSTDSYGTLIKRITEHKGVVGLLDGFLPWGFLQALMKGAVFSFGQAQSMNLLEKHAGLSHQTATVLSGGMGGFIQGVAMSPLLLLKTRVMTDPSFRAANGALESTKMSASIGVRMVKSEGLASLSKGMFVFAWKRFADWTTRYLFVVLVEEATKIAMGRHKLTSTEKIVCSLAGGTLSALVTIPIDVLVATVQQSAKAGAKVGLLDTYREQIKKGGLSGTVAFATRGTVARVAHVALTTMLMKTVTTFIYDHLYR